MNKPYYVIYAFYYAINEMKSILNNHRAHHLDQHRIAAFYQVKKILMHCNGQSIQWKRRVFKRIQGTTKKNIFL